MIQQEVSEMEYCMNADQIPFSVSPQSRFT